VDEKQRDLILYVFDCIEEIHGRTFIQKLFYIIKMQTDLNLFEFIPYNYGPFSVELNEAITDLVNEGILTEKKVGDYYLYSINGKFINEFRKKNIFLNSKQKANLKGVCDVTKKYKPRELLRYVYQHYPESTVNSLLRKDRRPQI